MTQVNIKDNSDVTIDAFIRSAVSKKTGNPYKCVIVKLGDYSCTIFPNSQFEWNYLESILREETNV